AGDRSPISGYHDCQRPLVAGGTRYGPEVALYAADGSHPDGAVLQVFARDGAYAPLGVEPGFNCLYPAGVGDGWMVPVGTDEAACLKPRRAHGAKGTRLEVRPESSGGEVGAQAPE